MFDDEMAHPRSISLTPLIDVVFLLLIFFMLASNFQQTQSLSVLTPHDAPIVAADNETVIEVRLMSDGTFRVAGKPVPAAVLAAVLKAAAGGLPGARVFILAETGARVQPLVQAIEAARAAGITSIETARSP